MEDDRRERGRRASETGDGGRGEEGKDVVVRETVEGVRERGS